MTIFHQKSCFVPFWAIESSARIYYSCVHKYQSSLLPSTRAYKYSRAFTISMRINIRARIYHQRKFARAYHQRIYYPCAHKYQSALLTSA